MFRPRTPPEAIDLVSTLLEYTPSKRITPLPACVHNFFDELRDPATRLPNGRELPPLFNFTPQGFRFTSFHNSRDKENLSLATKAERIPVPVCRRRQVRGTPVGEGKTWVRRLSRAKKNSCWVKGKAKKTKVGSALKVINFVL